MPDRLSILLEALRLNEVRLTTPRRAILQSLVELGSLMTVDELTTEVRRRHPEVHESTVYRTLDRLTALGLVDHVHLGHGRAVFGLADRTHQHLHCGACGKVLTAPSSLFAEIAQAVDERYEFELRLGHFALGGRCRNCRS